MVKKKSKKTKRKVAKKSNSNTPSFLKKVVLFSLTFLVPIVFFNLPSNKRWVEGRALPYYKDIKRQSSNMDVHSRKLERHGVTYQIANYVCNNVPKGSWFLMPPQAFYLDRIYASGNSNVQEIYRYISHINIFAFHCMDLNLLEMNMSKEELSKAQYTLDIQPNGSMGIVSISSPDILNQVLQRFSYDYDLATTQSATVAIVNDLRNKR